MMFKQSVKYCLILLSLFCAGTGQSAFAQQTPVTVSISDKVIRMQDGEVCYLHTVQRKQTLYSIAKAYGVDQQIIIDKNPVLKLKPLQVKQTLIIPKGGQQAQSSSRSQKTQNNTSGGEESSTIVGFDTKPNKVFTQDVNTPSDHDEKVTEATQELVANTPEDDSIDLSKPLMKIPAPGDKINIVLMMPFGGDGSMNENSGDFFEGALLALEDWKQDGGNVNLILLATQSGLNSMQDMIDNGALDGAHLIIGPVYAESFAPVAKWGLKNRVPVISPLATVKSSGNPYVIQFPAQGSTKYDKIKPLINNPACNVILLSPDNVDTQALQDFETLAPKATVVHYNRMTPASTIAALMDSEKKNIVLIPANTNSVEEILSKIAAANAPIKKFDIMAVGTSRWRGLVNMNNYELMFKTNAAYPSSYYSDKNDPKMDVFYNRYYDSFGRFPSLFAMRGYDILKVMWEAIDNWSEEALVSMPAETFTPLQTPYTFNNKNKELENSNWVMVQHSEDHKITVN